MGSKNSSSPAFFGHNIHYAKCKCFLKSALSHRCSLWLVASCYLADVPDRPPRGLHSLPASLQGFSGVLEGGMISGHCLISVLLRRSSGRLRRDTPDDVGQVIGDDQCATWVDGDTNRSAAGLAVFAM